MRQRHGALLDSGVAAPLPAAELDLRLAIGAVAAWLALAGCLTGSAVATVRLAIIAALVGGLTLALPRIRCRRWAAALALACFCIALALVPLAGRIGHARASPLVVLARQHERVTVDLTLDADPVVLAATGPGGAARVAVRGSASSVDARAAPTETDGAVLVLADAAAWRGMLPGQRVRVDGTLAPELGGGELSVTLFARTAPQRLGEPPWWQRVAGTVRSSLRRAAAGLPAAERGLLPGLVDGDTADLDPVLAERFRLAGLTHLVAVSGTNCSIVVGAVVLALRRARARPWLIAVGGGVVLAMFVVVARPSPSVLRAALMAAIALLSLATGRPRAGLPVLAAAVMALLLWDPTLAVSASFAMSVLATAALLVIAPGWARGLRARRVPAGIAESVAVAAAAHLVTAPVVAAISGRVSLVAVAANVLAEPVVAVTTVLGFAAAVVAPVWLGAGAALAWVAGWPCRWLVWVAEFFGGLHGATVPWPGGLAGASALVALLVAAVVAAGLGAWRVLAAGAATALLIFIPVRSVTTGWPPPGWVFVACDVGQGDALVLRAGPGVAVEIDAGPDPVAIDRCLRDLGITRIPLLLFTHFHLDHVGGVAGAVRGREVGRILVGPLDEPASGQALVRRAAAGARASVGVPRPGTRLSAGRVRLDFIGPQAAYRGTRSDPNNSSLVVRAEIGGATILLPGDAEVEAQQDLLAAGADLRADVLKVPHHGSAYSDPAFLAAVHARLAVISVGAHNDYGHPSPLLLARLARLGVPVLRTDRAGDVAVTSGVGRVAAVQHGVEASTVGLGERPRPWRLPADPTPAAALPVALSGSDAWMGACPRDRSAWTTCPARCPSSSYSSAMRTCSSTARSARSPPQPAAPTQA